ncbi:hypothetical protein [Streptomyces mesophilus]|uniref:hypothetical protein n=1 Tax=Streptomyces mesophilus TaxID=1775132 RepID=UPI00331CC051
MGIFRDRLPRDLSEPLDSDIDKAVRVGNAHRRHDLDRHPRPSKTKGDTSGPSSTSASTPQRRGWRR